MNQLFDHLAARRCRSDESTEFDVARLVKLASIAVLAFAGLLAMVCLFNGSGQRAYEVDPSALAGTMAERFVRQDLLCPATATFGSSPTIQRDGEGWRVTSYVDSQNAFGANVRERWTATVKQQGSTWELTNLEWGNQ